MEKATEKERLRALTDAMRAFADAADDSGGLLATVCRRLTDVVGDACAAFVVSEDGLRLDPTAMFAPTEAEAAEVRAFVQARPLVLSLDPSLDRLMESGQPLVVPRRETEAFRAAPDGGYTEVENRIGVHSLVAASLGAPGKREGVLCVWRFRPTSPSFDEDEVALVQNLAVLASIALETSRARMAERAARREAELSRARFDRLAESGILGIHVWKDGRVLAVNDYVVELLGYAREALVDGDVRWDDVNFPEWADVDARAHESLATTGVAPLRAKELKHQNGRRVPVLVGSAKLDTGEVISFFLDLTAQRIAQAQADVARLVGAADDAIIGKTLEGEITSWNPGATRLFGFTAAEAIGRNIRIIVPPERESEETALLSRLAHGEVAQFDTVRLRKDGTRVHVSVTSAPVRGEDGVVIGISKVARDITERKRAELALLSAKESLDATNRELEAFSYSVAHDLRAPLRGMSGFAQLLLTHEGAQLDADGKDWLQEIVGNAGKMASLIDALLSLSRLSRAKLRREPVDLSALARSALSTLQAAEPGRVVSTLVAPDLTVVADPTLTAALLENLLGNAWKFTRDTADARIEVGLEPSDGDRAFFVRDNGAGFDMAHARKLFMPFQRLHTTVEFPGTGIGLANVQRIVNRHGGRVWAEGAVGRGATFRFTLPTPDEDPS